MTSLIRYKLRKTEPELRVKKKVKKVVKKMMMKKEPQYHLPATKNGGAVHQFSPAMSCHGETPADNDTGPGFKITRLPTPKGKL
ncbi:UNVERIFIED_CONTAM: hypothetical protein K2H54_007457 [Gekko kuhli]